MGHRKRVKKNAAIALKTQPQSWASWVLSHKATLGILTLSIVTGAYQLYQGSSEVSACSNFHHFSGPKPGNSHVTILGENHDFRLQTTACLEELSKGIGPHTVYLESASRGMKVDCEEYSIPKTLVRTCVGWDNDLSRIEELDSAYAEFFNTVQKKYQQQSRSSVDLEIYLKNLHKDFSENLAKFESSVSEANLYSNQQLKITILRTALKMIKNVQTKHEQGQAWSEVFMQPMFLRAPNEAIPKDDQDAAQSVLQRNKDLWAAMEVAFKAEPRSFFIGGLAHFFCEPSNEPLCAGANYIQNQLKTVKADEVTTLLTKEVILI